MNNSLVPDSAIEVPDSGFPDYELQCSIITLTKHPMQPYSSAAPQGDGAPAHSSKKTSSERPSGLSPASAPATASSSMVAAGVAVLWRSGVVEGQLGSDRLLVAEIFEAMSSAAKR
jgi:hypothetical protein